MTPEIDRRGFLRCMAWAGTGVAWTVTGGLLSGCGLGAAPQAAGPRTRDLFFVQVSDSHIGFRGTANQDVTGIWAIRQGQDFTPSVYDLAIAGYTIRLYWKDVEPQRGVTAVAHGDPSLRSGPPRGTRS